VCDQLSLGDNVLSSALSPPFLLYFFLPQAPPSGIISLLRQEHGGVFTRPNRDKRERPAHATKLKL